MVLRTSYDVFIVCLVISFSFFLINLPFFSLESVGCAIWLFSRELVSTWSWVLLRFQRLLFPSSTLNFFPFVLFHGIL